MGMDRTLCQPRSLGEIRHTGSLGLPQCLEHVERFDHCFDPRPRQCLTLPYIPFDEAK